MPLYTRSGSTYTQITDGNVLNVVNKKYDTDADGDIDKVDSSVSGGSSQIILYPTCTTYVSCSGGQGSTSDQHTNPMMGVLNDSNGYYQHSLIRFDFSKLNSVYGLSASDISTATLYVYKYGQARWLSWNPGSVDLTYTNGDWNAGTVTWDNKPSEGSLIARVSNPNAPAWLSFNIKSSVQDILNGTVSPFYGYYILPYPRNDSWGNVSLYMRSSMAATHTPYVKITIA